MSLGVPPRAKYFRLFPHPRLWTRGCITGFCLRVPAEVACSCPEALRDVSWFHVGSLRGRSCRALDRKETPRDGDGSYLQTSASVLFRFVLPRLVFAFSRARRPFKALPSLAALRQGRHCLRIVLCITLSASFILAIFVCLLLPLRHGRHLLCVLPLAFFKSVSSRTGEVDCARGRLTACARRFAFFSHVFWTCRTTREQSGSGYSCVIVAV